MVRFHSKGRSLDATVPLVMGVLNCTDDSFYAASRSTFFPSIKVKIDEMVAEGVDILDIGGCSSRPGSLKIPVQEEMNRISEAIDYTTANYPDLWLSVDTFHASVAKFALDKGVHIINDISAGDADPDMIPLAAAYQVPFICNHMQGSPQTMQLNPEYSDITQEVLDYFRKKVEFCKHLGLEQLVLDPGFGFGKTIAHNYTLVRELEILKSVGLPLLVGFSRKSMIYKLLNTSPEEALTGTIALHAIALEKGADILRVHDVKEAKETIRIHQAIHGKA